jgi:transposase
MSILRRSVSEWRAAGAMADRTNTDRSLSLRCPTRLETDRSQIRQRSSQQASIGQSSCPVQVMLKQIMRRRRKSLFLVVDSLPAHKAKLVRDYVETTDGKMKLYFLPGYAPELNPDELVWSHMKRTGTAKRPLASNELLQERIEADLINIQNNRALVRSFFKAPDVAYIADG